MASELKTLVADFDVSLADSVAVADTTATLSSVTDDDGNTLVNGEYAFTVDNGSSSKEYFTATLTSTALTNVKSINRQGTESTGFARKHRRGAQVIISDWVHLKRIQNLLDGTTDLDSGTPIKYDGTVTPTDADELAPKSYVDSVGAGSANYDQNLIAAQAGETIAAGEAVYLKTSDGEWYKTDASAAATSQNVAVGIAQGVGTDGNAITGGVLVSGIDKNATYTAGSKYYLSDTAGALATSAGTFEVFVGEGDANNNLVWQHISNLETLTADEKDALVGDAGAPDTNNKFLTQESIGKVDQSQTTANGTTAVGEADATTKHNKIAQSFVANNETIASVDLYKRADTGSFTGTVTVAIQSDSSGAPDGVALTNYVITNADWLLIATGQFNVKFTTAYTTLTPGTTYWIVLKTSTSDNSNHPNFGHNTAGGYASGSVMFKNAPDGWGAIATIDLYFRTYTHFSIANNNYGFADDTGSNDTYVVTLDPAPTGWFQGMEFSFQANTVNTGACTINPNSLGAKSIKLPDGTDPEDGDIPANGIVHVTYDGVNAVMQTPTAQSTDLETIKDSVPNTLPTSNDWFSWTIPVLYGVFTGPTEDVVGWEETGLSGTITDKYRGGAGVASVGLNQDGYMVAAIPGSGSSIDYDAADSKDIRIKFRYAMTTTIAGNNNLGIGMADAAATFDDTETGTAINIRFVNHGGTLYAVNANGSSVTATDISSGITLTDYNVYEIVFNPGTDVKFYINGTLKATHTTNLPTGSIDRFGLGYDHDGTNFTSYISPITFSLEI